LHIVTSSLQFGTGDSLRCRCSGIPNPPVKTIRQGRGKAIFENGSGHFDQVSDVEEAIRGRPSEDRADGVLKEQRTSFVMQCHCSAHPDEIVGCQRWSRFKEMLDRPEWN